MLTIAKISGAGLAALALTIPAATAAVTVDSATGTGFVGKGDVQSALGYNNAELQRNAGSLAFTLQLLAEQALSQSAGQSASESAAQTVTRTVSCVVETKQRTFTNLGTRVGEREGERSGSRTGTRPGTLTGSITSSVAVEARVKNQITGFHLRGLQAQPSFVASGPAVWGDLTLGEWSYTDWSWGDTEWSGWVSEPGQNPADCLRTDRSPHGPEVSELQDVTTVDTTTGGGLVEGAVEYGDVVAGVPAAIPGSVARLFVNGVPLS